MSFLLDTFFKKLGTYLRDESETSGLLVPHVSLDVAGVEMFDAEEDTGQENPAQKDVECTEELSESELITTPTRMRGTRARVMLIRGTGTREVEPTETLQIPCRQTNSSNISSYLLTHTHTHRDQDKIQYQIKRMLNILIQEAGQDTRPMNNDQRLFCALHLHVLWTNEEFYENLKHCMSLEL